MHESEAGFREAHAYALALHGGMRYTPAHPSPRYMPAPPATSSRERLIAEVIGHVQGVGFRYYVRQMARRYGLVGFVRNDAEGTVTVTAEGSRARLDAFVETLHQGPDMADVEEVDVRWEPATGRFKTFAIEYA